MGLAGWITLVIVVLVAAIAIFVWLYRRASNEVSLVKTGVGGRKVVIDGGALAIPYLHEIATVNMQSLRLEVRCKGDRSLITRDYMRVDVGADFYVSVAPTTEAVARAAQTLGRRTFQPEELRALIDGMLVDALLSTAAKMTLEELHENRSAFVAEVRESLEPSIGRYGLQLDAVSLTALDQTPFASMDENNAFNAVGMRKLAEVIAKSKKERAEIDADAEVSVRKAAMDATLRRLLLELEESRAKIEQQKEIETLSAAQIAEIAQRKAESELTASEARIRMERGIRAAEIERERALSIAETEGRIAISEKAQDESRALALAEAARADAIRAEEAVQTARAMAEAERRKEIALTAARAEAEASAARAAIIAQSERATAKDRAEAMREEAEAKKAVKIAEAEAARAHIDAENARSEALIAMELEKERLAALPKVVAEMVKPAEKIKEITIHQLSGGFGTSEERPAVNQALDSMMEMAVKLPSLRKLGESIGIDVEESLRGPKPKKDETKE